MVKKKSTFKDKWGEAIASGGHTSIPNDLLELRKILKITEVQFLIIVCVLKFKWYSDNPYPSADTLSKLSGLSISTVRHNLQSLEKSKLIRKISRFNSRTSAQESNEYSFTPMKKILESYTQHLRKRTPRYLAQDRTPYPAQDTKEDQFKKTKERRRNWNGGKPESLANIMATRARSP